MQEEFGADVPEENITILGLLETKPPAANHHYSFALKVKIKETFKELKEKWSKAEDKWEGEMLPLPLTKEAVAEKIFGKEFGETRHRAGSYRLSPAKQKARRSLLTPGPPFFIN